ncbi:MAG: PAS domain S-box protein [Desulfobacterales bacterium]
MIKIDMRYKRITLIAAVICLIFFCAFVMVCEHYALKKAEERIAEHARIISDNLWNYNAQGAVEYLKLAAKSQNYESLVVTDHGGRIFNQTQGTDFSSLERFLIRVKLLPRVKLLAAIEHNGSTIGGLEAVWVPQTLYSYAYVFFAFLLLLVIIYLYLRVLDEKRFLGKRVHENTAELLEANALLQEEIKERIQAEEALRESEQKYRILTDNVNDMIWTVDMDFNFTYINPVTRKIYGLPKDEWLPYRKIQEVLTPSSFEAVREMVKKKSLLGERTGNYDSPTTMEIEVILLDGSTVWVEVKASFMIGKNGKPEGIVGIARDITERFKAQLEKEDLQKKLERSKKMESLGLLAGGVAHDLNNVLSGIVSYPDLLLMDLPEDSALREPIETIKESGLKAARIVQDLLTLARRGVVATEVLNMNNLITDYLESPEYKKLLTYHPNIVIQTCFETNLPNIVGSSFHLRKTIMNLVSNASEAQPKGGNITISTESRYLDKPIKGYDNVKEGDYIIMRIEDRGEGIVEEDLYRIFEPFYTKKVMGRSGTGLGMAVVWGTVQDHKGYIDIHSKIDQGTVFELYFPITRESLSEKENVLLKDSLRGDRELILVVDDMEDQRKIASSILEKLNYEVITVSGGEEAVNFIRDYPVDLVILDMIMEPGIDGLETYKRIIKLYPGQRAIIASGFSETEQVREAQRLGAGEHIKKPYMIENIGLVIKKALAK